MSGGNESKLRLETRGQSNEANKYEPLLNQKRYQNRRLIPIGLLHASIIFSLRR